MIGLEGLDPFHAIDPLVQSSDIIINQSELNINLDQQEYFVNADNGEDLDDDEAWVSQDTGEILRSAFDLFED